LPRAGLEDIGVAETDALAGTDAKLNEMTTQSAVAQ
jgi:hypothetical protein